LQYPANAIRQGHNSEVLQMGDADFERFRAGDETAFNAVGERYRDALLATATRRLYGDENLAEDAVQQALLKVYREPGAYKQGTHFKVWIHSVVSQCALNLLRAKRAA
jgi:RNA polymerase sigma-70 factor (ECF subfamily)